MTRAVLDEQAQRQEERQRARPRFGRRAKEILIHWSGEPDRWKGNQRMRDLVRRFPVLSSLAKDKGLGHVEELLHAWGGTKELEVGIVTSRQRADTATLRHGAVTIILDDAVRRFHSGQREEALRLLGISLHAVQDFCSHHLPLQERNEAGRRPPDWWTMPTVGGPLGVGLPPDAYAEYMGPVNVLEDDPKLGLERWAAARRLTGEQLDRFYNRVGEADRDLLAAGSL